MPKATIMVKSEVTAQTAYGNSDKEYKRKKNCEECAHLSKEKCKKTDATLTRNPSVIAFFPAGGNTANNSAPKSRLLLEEIQETGARRAQIEEEQLNMSG